MNSEFDMDGSPSRKVPPEDPTFFSIINEGDRQALIDIEKRYVSLLENLPVGIFRTSTDGRFLSVNRALVRMAGCSSHEEMMSIPTPDFYLNLERRQELLEILETEGSVTDFQTEVKRRDGEILWISMSIDAAFAEDGSIMHFDGICRDITKLKRAEIQLKRRTEELDDRVRELNCLYSISRLRETAGILTDSFLNEVIKMIPAAFRNPEQVCACLRLGRKEYCCDGFVETDTGLTEEVRVGGDMAGRLLLFRNQDDVNGEPPDFTQHERSLVGAVASEIGKYLNRVKSDGVLRRNEQRLQLALEGAKGALWDYNPSTGDTYYSPEWYKMLGFEPDELPHREETWSGLLHPEDKAKTIARLQTHVRDGTDYSVEFRMQTKSGGWRWIHSRGKTVSRDSSGCATRMVGIHTDITERKQADDALKKSEEQYRTLQENIPVGVFRSTPEGRFLSANPAMVEMYGCESVEELLSVPAPDFYCDPDTRRHLMNCLAESMSVVGFEAQIRRRDGATIWVASNVHATLDEDGNIKHLDGVAEDFTERKLAEERDRAAYQEKYDQVKRIAGVFAHEIRNGLFPASATLSILKREASADNPDFARIREFAASAERAVANAAGTTKMITSFTRRGTDLMPEYVDISQVVHDVVSKNRPQINADGISIHISGTDGYSVRSNRQQLVFAMNNMMVNSLDAVSNREQPRISVTWQSNGDYVELVFEDNGCGIAEDNIASVFEPFFSTKSHKGGTGIGLATTKRIVEMYGGSIQVSSRMGHWTRFDIRLQLAESDRIRTERRF